MFYNSFEIEMMYKNKEKDLCKIKRIPTKKLKHHRERKQTEVFYLLNKLLICFKKRLPLKQL